jgi:hypothetical protein
MLSKVNNWFLKFLYVNDFFKNFGGVVKSNLIFLQATYSKNFVRQSNFLPFSEITSIIHDKKFRHFFWEPINFFSDKLAECRIYFYGSTRRRQVCTYIHTHMLNGRRFVSVSTWKRWRKWQSWNILFWWVTAIHVCKAKTVLFENKKHRPHFTLCGIHRC